MKAKYVLYVRQHVGGWYTASVLDMPYYSAYGPQLSLLREELAEVLKRDLSDGSLKPRERRHDKPMKHRSITIEIKAVQHHRLVTVPLRVSLFSALVDEDKKLYDVRLPRIGASYTIVGEKNVEPWAEEIVRGHFHLSSVEDVMAHQYERAEKLDQVEVTYTRTSKSRAVVTEKEQEARQKAAHPLAAFGAELVDEAKEKRVGRALYREEAMRVLIGAASARHQSSVLLVGGSGAGKTALVNELAHRIVEERAGKLNGARIWSIGGARIIAGAKFLGEWQERCKMVTDLVTGAGDIWFAGSLLELLSSGQAKTGHGVAQFLLPEVRSGSLTLILETTPDALAVAESLDAAFVRSLQRVYVEPLSLSVSEDILERHAVSLVSANKIEWGEGTVVAALDVVARFGDADGLPGSAIALLDRMAALKRSDGRERATVEKSLAVETFAKMTGFPLALVDPDQRLDVDAVREFFTTRVVGQAAATDRLTNLIMLLKAGLDDPDRPLGSFLFTGPTGVGKTESALTLAEYLFSDRKRVVRFDMSEYAYPGSSLRLVDGPDGEGELTRPVRRQPFSLLLFDEVEKADPSVLDVLLQILGEGRLTDGTGRTVRFTHAIVIMTSNLGATRKSPVGFAGDADPGARYREAVERFFRPELLNRIDHVVPFSDLGRDSLVRIARRLVDRALEREGLTRYGANATYTDAVIERLTEEGFDPRYGARPMKRAVDTSVVVPLARQLAERGDRPFARVFVDVEDDQIVVRLV